MLKLFIVNIDNCVGLGQEEDCTQLIVKEKLTRLVFDGSLSEYLLYYFQDVGVFLKFTEIKIRRV